MVDAALELAVREVTGRADARRAVEDLHASIDSAIAARAPQCRACGRCCRFAEFGHRLYITTLELGVFVAQVQRSAFRLSDMSQRADVCTANKTCSFQTGDRCGVHPIRPMACRIFFCDESAQAWQHELYRDCHGVLRELHVKLGIPYRYVQWR